MMPEPDEGIWGAALIHAELKLRHSRRIAGVEARNIEDFDCAGLSGGPPHVEKAKSIAARNFSPLGRISARICSSTVPSVGGNTQTAPKLFRKAPRLRRAGVRRRRSGPP